MIISASYKTDIPCFYGQWLMNRLDAGYCKMVNPYSRQIYRISLAPSDVEGFVFWTKNLGPFMRHLPEIHARGFPFFIQYSITAYPRALEHSVTDAAQAVEHVRRVAAEYGPRSVVWRYDPILFSSQTPLQAHVENFARLARALEGATDEAVISFAHMYRKTERNLMQAAKQEGITWEDPPEPVKAGLVESLAEIACSAGMQLRICSQNQYLQPGVRPAQCIDAERLSWIAGRPIPAKRSGNRPDCCCDAAKDIGEYDTCPHGCIYCYAVQSSRLARLRYAKHDPAGEFLFPPTGDKETGRSPLLL